MTAIDDLKPGQYIAVTKRYVEDDVPNPFGFFMPRQPLSFSGVPVKIITISLPFLAVEDKNGRVSSIDVREWGVQRVSRQYAEAFDQPEPTSKRTSFTKRRKKKSKPDPRDCPRCGERMIQRMIAGTSRGFVVVCPCCGFEKPA